MQVEAKTLYGWNTYELSSSQLSLSLIPLGGRIISLRFCGEELFFYQKEHSGESFDFTGLSKEDLDKKKQELGFRLWGGDKTWAAPQSSWSEAIPPLVIDAGHYQIQVKEKSIVLTSPVDPETGLQVSRELSLTADAEVSLKQGFHNRTEKIIEKGIWNVSQMLRNVFVYIPITTDKIVFYPGEGSSAALQNEIVTKASKNWSRIRCDEAKHFKYGGPLKTGQIITLKPLAKKNTFLLMERLFSIEQEGKYAHGSSVFEVYNSPAMDYAEVEVHAPFQPIPPGASIYHSQTWRFRHITEEGISSLLN